MNTSTLSRTLSMRLFTASLLCAFCLFGALFPKQAEAFEVAKTTARPNIEGTSNILGGLETRVTFEATVSPDEQVQGLTLIMPEGGSFASVKARVNVLHGLERLPIKADAQIADNQVTLHFSEPVGAGRLIRVELTDAVFPEAGGSYTISGSYTTEAGTQNFAPAPALEIVSNHEHPAQKLINWLDKQDWVAQYNSHPFLGMFLKPQLMVSSLVTLFPGWLVCLGIVLAAYPFALCLGLLFALMKTSKLRILRALAIVYVNFLRGTPLFLQIYIMFFGLPMLGITIDNVLLGMIVMAINSSAYLSEIIRAGIQSIARGQYEAAASLGMNRTQTLFYIILPQTITRVIPTITSDFITSFKDTSLLSSVGVMELMMFAKNLTTVSGNMTPYVTAAFFYLIVTLPMIKIVGIIEARMNAEHRAGSTRSLIARIKALLTSCNHA